MMLHHVSVGVKNVERAGKFYDAVLKTLGYKRVWEIMPYGIAYGENGYEFWVQLPHDQKSAAVGNGPHFAFNAPTKASVHAFHAAALAHGGTDDGKPGPRPDYGPDYYGAFVRDPDGNKIEAVLTPEPKATTKPKRKAKAAKKPAKKAKKKAKRR